MKTRITLIAALLLIFSLSPRAHADWTIDAEGGVAFNGYNDIRIPGDGGSDISLTDDLSSDATGYWRLRLGIDLGQRHRLSLLVAPLRINASGTIDRVIDYNGVQFAAGEMLHARYRFDSYRLTYSYALVQSNDLDFDIGVTAKIRDAGIRIASEIGRAHV